MYIQKEATANSKAKKVKSCGEKEIRIDRGAAERLL
jgi:hypothetical protein